MGKPTKKESEADKIRLRRLYCLHRECVRRNLEYGVAYREGMRMQESTSKSDAQWILRFRWNIWPPDELPDPSEASDLEQLNRQQLSTSVNALPRDTQVDPLEHDAARILTNALLHPNRQVLGEVANRLKGFVFMLYFPEELDQQFPALWSLTALDVCRSKKELTAGLQGWLEQKLAHRTSYGFTQKMPRIRMHLDECFEYVRAYDLRRADKTFREIATVLWPDRAAEELTRQAKTYCDKGEALVCNPPFLRLKREHISARARVEHPEKDNPAGFSERG